MNIKTHQHVDRIHFQGYLQKNIFSTKLFAIYNVKFKNRILTGLKRFLKKLTSIMRI